MDGDGGSCALFVEEVGCCSDCNVRFPPSSAVGVDDDRGGIG